LRIYKKNKGILLIENNLRISLDTDDYDSHLSFISHAHADHLPKKVNRLYASRETIALSKFRGLKYDSIIEEDRNLAMFDSGHILGSKSLLVNDKILYTGDICVRERGYLKGAEAVNCKVLIIESTYGISYFKFPPLEEILSETKRLIEKNLASGRHIALCGYELGKAQLLTYLFNNYKPLIIHDIIFEINRIYRKLGIDLKDKDSIRLSEAETNGFLKKDPHVIILPMNPKYSREIKNKYKTVSIAFTGWSLIRKETNEYDFMFPLSDHSDFYELVDYVKKCNPELVATFHGYSREFAKYLKNLGFKAFELNENEKLDSFS